MTVMHTMVLRGIVLAIFCAASVECLQDFAFVQTSLRSQRLDRSFSLRQNICPISFPACFTRSSRQQKATGSLKLASVVEGFAVAGHLGAMLTAIDFSTVGLLHEATLLAQAAATDAAATAAATTDAAATAAAAKAANPGLYDSFVNLIEQSLILLHSSMKAVGVPGAWGMSIILFTVLIKTLTYPLNYKQMASTIQMQNLQPKIKALQSRYQNDPQKLNEMTAKLYQDEKINPFAGCIPALVQIPVFIALYRSLLDLAKKDLLTESFLWIPSLEGPVGEYSPTTGLPVDGTAWLFKGWTDGHPALGWEDTAAYFSIPIILVVSQYLSQKVLQPTPSTDPAQQQTQQILKFLPLMIGWFSLNVPAGLGVYWVINNVISTGQQWYIRQQVKASQPAAGATAGTVAEVDFAPAATKLRTTDEIKFKVGKKAAAAESPASQAAVVMAAAESPAQGAESEEDEEEGAEDAVSGAAATESKSAMKKKAKALKTKK